MKLLIQNGRLIDPAAGKDGLFDVLVEEGKIKEILKPGTAVTGAEIINAKGLVVAPGFVDLHTHLREPGQEYKETIQTGTQAAASGGFTSVCCMANTDPVNDSASVTDYILKQSREKGVVNVFPIGALTKNLEGRELANYGELKKAGCIGLSDDGRAVENNQVMRLAMEYAKNFDLTVITHSVDPCLTNRGVMNESFVSTKLGLPGIPNEAEDIMIARDLLLARLTGARLHVAHIATAGGLKLIRWAKQEGIQITCEVTPHHLALTDEAVCSYDTNTKMMPPLRSEDDRKFLLEGLCDGTIDAIATDHAPHALVDKQVEYDCAANGIIGLESAFGVVWNLAEKQKMGLSKLIEAMTIRAARVVGIPKGTLTPGSDADIVCLNPNTTYTLEAGHFHSKSKNTPFIGTAAKGKIEWTMVAGKKVYG